jgi:hypothetical protein
MTSLAGAHKSNASDIVLSMERMNQIAVVDTQSRTLTVEAGAFSEIEPPITEPADYYILIDVFITDMEQGREKLDLQHGRLPA